MHHFVKAGLVAAGLLLSTPLVSLSQAEDVMTINSQKVYGDCIEEYNKYENDPEHKAFAVARNGRYCGWSYNYDTVDEAEAKALAECRVGGRNCRVIASY